ncbi:RNA polymerase sigma-54 factor RpoN [Octadecabacter antarcticus 307]|uniref:RNA polymerase sigma-54 factor n=1 Tax=Octadecabacter antarcticus 307 TaxID=391626 RepID=M9R8L1_9RHOB|nr:RNA polymerase factor sigma-54 [Octadecabacter antarcticus]AGI68557.1 RNA polymerase sigma-54 factor RpoN [Octadecabacter antarcticus 307]
MLNISISTNISQNQSLVFTPQLQQAIKLLLLNNIELSSYAESIAEENPFLEIDLPEVRMPASQGANVAQKNSEFDPISLLPDKAGESFGARLFAQVDDTLKDQAERAIGYALASHLDPTGWLTTPLSLLAQNLNVEEKYVAAVLSKLQRAEPTGLFARDLSECLSLQIPTTDLDHTSMGIIIANLALLERGLLNEMRRKVGCSADELRYFLRRLRGLNPKPGLALSEGDQAPIRAPDLLTAKGPNGEWFVKLNGSTLPIIKVDEAAGQRVRKFLKLEIDQIYVRENLGNARWLKRAIAQRNETSIKVAAEIVRIQLPFLEHGIKHMRPLKLKTIAEAVGLHESTISRVTSALMIQTPQGTLPLKTFFSNAIELNGSDEGASARMVREKVRTLIGQEVPIKPLSDEFIMQKLNSEGLSIARRTIAKYRKLDKIPSSCQRRRNYQLQATM